MKRFSWLLLGVVILTNGVGCGDNKTVIPDKPFTEEQKKAIQAEDRSVEDEESQGKLPKKKGKK